MKLVSYGDLATFYRNHGRTAEIKSNLAKLTNELSSGRKSDVSVGTSFDYMPVVSLERSISALTTYETAQAEARLFAETMQASLDKIEVNSDKLSAAMLTAGNSVNRTMIDSAAADAANRFESVIAAFNSRVSDRYAFAGTAYDQPAVADAQTILTDLMTAAAGQTTAAGVETVLDTWFDTPGGSYDTIAYVGSTQRLGPIRIGENQSVNLDATAADPEIRTVLKAFAMAALVDRGILSGDLNERAALTRRSGELITESRDDVVDLRARIGAAEARIADVHTALMAEKSALEMALSDIVSINPYQAATELEARQSQLETVFAITAKLSRLSLTEYLR